MGVNAMKKFISIVLILCMCFGTIASVNAENLNYGEYKYLEFTPDINIFAQSAFSASFKGTDGFSYLTSGDMSFKIYDTSNTYTAFQLNNKKVNNATVPNKIDINTTASRIDFMLGTWYINYGYHNTSNTHFLPTCAFQVVEVYLADGTVDKKYALLSRHSGGKDILDSMVVYAPKYDSAGNEIVYEGEEVLKTEGKTNPFKLLTASNVTADGISTKKLTVDDLVLPDDVIRPETDFKPTISPSANASFANFDAFSLDYESIKNIEKIIFPNNVTCHLNYKGAIRITNPEKNTDYMALVPINIEGANQQYNYYLYMGRIASEGALLSATAVVTNKAKIKTYEEKMSKAVSDGGYSLAGIRELKKEILEFCDQIGVDYEKDFDAQIRSAFEEEIARIDRETKDFDVYADADGLFIRTKEDISGEKVELFNGEELIISALGTGIETTIDVKLDLNTVYNIKIGDYSYNFVIEELINQDFNETMTGGSLFYMTEAWNPSTVYDKKFVLYENSVYVKPEFEIDLYENYTASFDMGTYKFASEEPKLLIGVNAKDYEHTDLTKVTGTKSAYGIGINNKTAEIFYVDAKEAVTDGESEALDSEFVSGKVSKVTYTEAKGGEYLTLNEANKTEQKVNLRKTKDILDVSIGTYNRKINMPTTIGGLIFAVNSGAVSMDNIVITVCREYIPEIVRNNAEIKIQSEKDGVMLVKAEDGYSTKEIKKGKESRVITEKKGKAELIAFESLATLKPVSEKIILDNLNETSIKKENVSVKVKDELKGSSICTVYDDKEAIMTFSFDDGVYDAAVYYKQLFTELGLKGTACLNKLNDNVLNNWREVFEKSLVDVSNHGRYHTQYRNYETDTVENRRIIEKDIAEGRMEIKNNFPDQQAVGYIAPYGALNDISRNMMEGYHWANRSASGIPYKYASLNPTEDEWFDLPSGTVTIDKPAETLNGWIDKALTNKTWFIELLHGIAEDDKPITGSTDYSIKKSVCREHFEYASTLTDRMWCATFEEGVKYIRERQNATLKTCYEGDVICVELTDTLPDRLFDFPLTVKVPVPADWTEAEALQNGETLSVRMETVNGEKFVYVNVVPDKGIAEIKQK